ncbi:MAG TPA: outer membrane beta-barrel protein, partial [Blastocatellia bacterium]|nr:outer membrane beta-barrel protein [Blastocatellia bacterium]
MKLISRFMVAAIFSALLAGDSIAQQMDGAKTKQVVAAAPGVSGTASTAVNGSPSENNKGSEPSERERLLLERIEKLEQRLAGLESRSAVKPANDSVQSVLTTTAAASPTASAKPDETKVEAAIAAAGAGTSPSQANEPKKKEPFAFADFTWLTGNPRTKDSPINTEVFTGEIRFDTAFHHSFNHPKDNTIGGSSEVFRSGEVQVTQIGVGGDFHYNNVRGRLMTQFGMYSQTTPRNDASPGRGQWNLDNAYRYISEAYGGYHIDKLNGINIDAGIFMSYVGLFSYYQFDNWAYQPSYVSSNTPWFFNGVRIQIFPTEKLKIEPWIVNGWQSYGRFNRAPGIGG